MALLQEALVAYTMTAVSREEEPDAILFVRQDGKRFILRHNQDCCEDVRLVDVTGDLQDLVDTPILVADERSVDATTGERDGAEEWTFYVFRTLKGTVTLRWCGESNGYYGTGVDFTEED